METLKQALEKMPFVFTSNAFSSVAQKYGLTKHEIERGAIATFLKQNCKQLESRKSWVKKDANENTIFQTIDLESAIKRVKEAGYKITKPVTDWVEI